MSQSETGLTVIGRLVVARTRNAGVHIGVVQSIDGETALLTDAYRLWRWKGANSLHEVATRGVDMDYTRVSEMTESIVINGWIELLPVTSKARASLTTPRWPGDK